MMNTVKMVFSQKSNIEFYQRIQKLFKKKIFFLLNRRKLEMKEKIPNKKANNSSNEFLNPSDLTNIQSANGLSNQVK